MNIFEQNELSSSSDEELEILFNRRIKHKNENYLEEIIPQYRDEEFMEHFRLSRHIAQKISERFARSEYFFQQSGEFGKLSAMDYTLIFLWFTGHEATSYRDVSDRFCISISTLRKVIQRMTYFLSNLSPEIILWPTQEEQLHIMEQFSTNGFPSVVGVIDGSHIRIDKPNEDSDSYLNRKGYYSMQFQIVCDYRRKITDVMVGFPGSVHDSRVFNASPLGQTLPQKCGNNYILGDSGYPCKKNLLTPFKDLGNLTARQHNYNYLLSKTRIVVEHCLGVMKQKFRQLYHLKLRDDHDIANFIRACCVLHNLGLEDDFPDRNQDAPDDAAVVEDYVEGMDNIRLAENVERREGFERRNEIVNILPFN